MHKRRLWIVGLALLIVTLACQLIGTPPPPVEETPRVVIIRPETRQQFPQGESITIKSTAVDTFGISRIELLINGDLHETSVNDAPEANKPFVAEQMWLPQTLGNHVIQVRAYNVNEAVDDSEQVFIEVLGPSGEIAQEPSSEDSVFAPPAEATATLEPTPTSAPFPASQPDLPIEQTTPLPPAEPSLPVLRAGTESLFAEYDNPDTPFGYFDLDTGTLYYAPADSTRAADIRFVVDNETPLLVNANDGVIIPVGSEPPSLDLCQQAIDGAPRDILPRVVEGQYWCAETNRGYISQLQVLDLTPRNNAIEVTFAFETWRVGSVFTEAAPTTPLDQTGAAVSRYGLEQLYIEDAIPNTPFGYFDLDKGGLFYAPTDDFSLADIRLLQDEEIATFAGINGGEIIPVGAQEPGLQGCQQALTDPPSDEATEPISSEAVEGSHWCIETNRDNLSALRVDRVEEGNGTLIITVSFVTWNLAEGNTFPIAETDEADPPTSDEFIVDNMDSGFTVEGTWFLGNGGVSYGENCHWTPPGVGNIARFDPDISRAGTYEIFAWSCGDPNHDQAWRTEVEIHPYQGWPGAVPSVRVNLKENAGEWVSLGQYYLQPTAFVQVDSNLNGNVVADALRFVYVSSQNVAATPTPLPPLRVSDSLQDPYEELAARDLSARLGLVQEGLANVPAISSEQQTFEDCAVFSRAGCEGERDGIRLTLEYQALEPVQAVYNISEDRGYIAIEPNNELVNRQLLYLRGTRGDNQFGIYRYPDNTWRLLGSDGIGSSFEVPMTRAEVEVILALVEKYNILGAGGTSYTTSDGIAVRLYGYGPQVLLTAEDQAQLDTFVTELADRVWP